MAKKVKAKKLTPFQRQMERGNEFAKLNEDFAERWYPNGEPNWSDGKVRSKAATKVLAFNVFRSYGGEHIGPLNFAFGELGLDPANPFHWRFLIEFLATALFATKPRRGRPLGTGKWNEEKNKKLQTHVMEYFEPHEGRGYRVKLKGSLPDKLAIARFIKKKHPEDYTHDEVDRIHREVIAIFKPFNSGIVSAVAAMMGDK